MKKKTAPIPQVVSWKNVIFLFIYAFPLAIALRNVLSGSIPFWYDPARDLLAGLANLHKLTLIGPPSGIPGIFYGPYWTWLLSLGLLISHNPRIVDLVILTLPYFTIFPFVLYQFSKYIGRGVMGSIWLLFLFSSGSYATFLWNPHLAPLLTLLVLYFLVTTEYKWDRKNLLNLFVGGLSAGLACNFHISFGIGLIIGSFLFLLLWLGWQTFQQKNHTNQLVSLLAFVVAFASGVVVAFVPFFLFEMRHHFQQSSVFLKEITSPTSSVLLKGLSRGDILNHFVLVLAKILSVPSSIGYLVLGFGASILVFAAFSHKILFSTLEKKLLVFLVTLSTTVLTIYLSAKNPVWEYHFIAVEIIWLFAVALVLKKITFLRYITYVWVGILVCLQFFSFLTAFSVNPYLESTLATKEHVVDLIYTDSGKKSFAVYVYNPAIYTYDYDYLFKWQSEKRQKTPVSADQAGVTYLILPKVTPAVRTDFIHYRTPDAMYATTKEWHIPDGTVILKRVKHEKIS